MSCEPYSNKELCEGIPKKQECASFAINGPNGIYFRYKPKDCLPTEGEIKQDGGKSASKKVKTPKGERTVHVGPRGGKYVLYNGKKVPVSRFSKK